ncbi:MAG: SDR family oxidoreductase [Spartobacteria bacterium]|nr:SDR family oxidoreductase [Spartobacteria bacterium]
MNKLAGKKAVITGASQGLGTVIARTFLAEGASVLLCARSSEVLSKTAAALCELDKNYADRLSTTTADVSKSDDAKKVIAMAEDDWGSLDILVNNAGIYGPMGRFHEVDFSEWVHAVEINLFGSALMCKYAIPLFLKGQGGRIIQLSGGGATSPLPNISAYAASKAGIVRLVETLAKEYRENEIFVNAIAPGALNTRLLDEVLDAGSEKVGTAFYEKAILQKETGGASMERAAELAVFLASDRSAGITGRLISSLWDPWERMDELCEALDKSDIYTLRRIVPQDRGLKWDEEL